MWAQEYRRSNDKVTFMNSMTHCVNKAMKEGYTESFQITAKGLQTASGTRVYRPEDVRVINFYRFEGESDPGDMSIMYVIETSDGTRGVLVDAYGPYSDGRVNNFMLEVETISKKIKNNRNAC